MRYDQSTDQSAELLRLILRRIAQHSTNYHPTTYSVWYEYLAQINPPLTRAVDERLHSERPLSKEETEELHEKYIILRGKESAEKLQIEIDTIIGQLAPVAEAASKNAADFSASLGRVNTRLGTGLTVEQLQSLVQELRQQTQVAQASADAMRKQVECVTEEITALKQQVKEIYSQAIKDPLTSLLNRRGFDQAAAELIKARTDGLQGCTIAMIDIDRFKRINDTFGHLTGDQVLRAVAHVLETTVTPKDIAARVGGEEFVLLLPDTSLPAAIDLAEQLRSAVTRVRLKRNGSTDFGDQVTISLGVASAEPGDSIAVLMDRADKALFAAKDGGRNRVQSYAQAS